MPCDRAFCRVSLGCEFGDRHPPGHCRRLPQRSHAAHPTAWSWCSGGPTRGPGRRYRCSRASTRLLARGPSSLSSAVTVHLAHCRLDSLRVIPQLLELVDYTAARQSRTRRGGFARRWPKSSVRFLATNAPLLTTLPDYIRQATRRCDVLVILSRSERRQPWANRVGWGSSRCPTNTTSTSDGISTKYPLYDRLKIMTVRVTGISVSLGSQQRARPRDSSNGASTSRLQPTEWITRLETTHDCSVE